VRDEKKYEKGHNPLKNSRNFALFLSTYQSCQKHHSFMEGLSGWL